MSDDMNNRGPEDYKFILGQEREFGYGPITGEDNVEHLAYLAAVMGLTASDIHELTVVANEAGMGLAELLAILATMSDLFAVISVPILPPITVHIIDTSNEDDTVKDIIADMNEVAGGIPSLVSDSTLAQIIKEMNEAAGDLPPMIGPGHVTLGQVIGTMDDRQPLDELATYRRRRHQQRIEELRSQNTVPSHMHRNVPGPLNTTTFVNGMVRRSMLFGQLIALGNMTPDVDADPDAMRAADMVRALTEGRRRAMREFEPYTEDPDTTDPAS